MDNEIKGKRDQVKPIFPIEQTPLVFPTDEKKYETVEVEVAIEAFANNDIIEESNFQESEEFVIPSKKSLK